MLLGLCKLRRRRCQRAQTALAAKEMVDEGVVKTRNLGGRRIYLTHYPHLGHGMACTGDYDLVCCGHSHETEIRQQANVRGGHTWLVNPGTVAGLGAPAATWI